MGRIRERRGQVGKGRGMGGRGWMVRGCGGEWVGGKDRGREGEGEREWVGKRREWVGSGRGGEGVGRRRGRGSVRLLQ